MGKKEVKSMAFEMATALQDIQNGCQSNPGLCMPLRGLFIVLNNLNNMSEGSLGQPEDLASSAQKYSSA